MAVHIARQQHLKRLPGKSNIRRVDTRASGSDPLHNEAQNVTPQFESV